MKITVTRSWLPWGKPDVKVEPQEMEGYYCIWGARKKTITIDLPVPKIVSEGTIHMCSDAE